LKPPICISALILALTLSPNAEAGDGLHLSTVVIDAGHGGKDPGAISKDRKTYEKDIVLDIAQRFAEKIRASYPEVNVILTRNRDVFIPLHDRAEIANKANANLFISIHVNAARNTSASGFSVHVMGQSSRKDTDLYELNMNSVMRENSVIKLEDDYSATYEGFDPSDPESYIFLQLMQDAYLEQSLSLAHTIKSHLHGGPLRNDRGISQNPFYVLWKTSMPAVLVELGFISNLSDLDTIRSSDKRETISGRLFSAFEEYKRHYDRSMGTSSTIPIEVSGKTDNTVSSFNSDTGSVSQGYGIQIFASTKTIVEGSSMFLGYTPKIVDAGNIKKYLISVSSDISQVKSNLMEIRKKYPDAFIVKIDGENIYPYKY